jgi:hypothetical protein
MPPRLLVMNLRTIPCFKWHELLRPRRFGDDPPPNRHEDAALTAKHAGQVDSKTPYRNYNNRVKKAAALTYFGIRPAQEAENILAIP